MFDRLTTFARLIQFDRRGSGMSDRVPPAPLEEQMDDVLAVLDAAGSERVALLAETEGTALACLFAATHPERVSSLTLFAPIPRITPPGLPVGARPGAPRDVHHTDGQRLGRGDHGRRRLASPSPASPACATGSRASSGSPPARPRSADDARDRAHRRTRRPAADPRPDARDAPPGDARVDRAPRRVRADHSRARASSSCRAPTRAVPRRDRAGRRRDRGVRDRHARRAAARARARHRAVHRHRRLDRAGLGVGDRRWRELLDGHPRSCAPRSPATAAGR